MRRPGDRSAPGMLTRGRPSAAPSAQPLRLLRALGCVSRAWPIVERPRTFLDSGVSLSAASGLVAQMALLHVINSHLRAGDPERSGLLAGEGASFCPPDSKGQRAYFLLPWVE